MKRIIKPWNSWSVSRLGLLFNCPLAFYFEYVEQKRNEVKQGIAKIFGQAIHHMVEQFFKVKYKSREKFVNALKFYWFEYIINNKYKFKIRVEEQRDYGDYFGKGVNILRSFWERNIKYRDDENLKPVVEKKFSHTFKGHRIRGVMDRIQPVNNGAEIWDYKTGYSKPREPELLRNIQFTIYNLAYLKEFGENPVRMCIEHLSSGEQYPVPIRTKDDYIQLSRSLDEATVYVKSILNPYSSKKWKDIAFEWLNPEDVEKKYFPKRPSYFCNWCDYHELCREFKPKDAIRERLVEIELQRTGPYPKYDQTNLFEKSSR